MPRTFVQMFGSGYAPKSPDHAVAATPITDAESLGTARYLWSGATGANNGTSWTNAWTSMATAAAAITRGQTLAVADGAYTGATFSRAASLTTMISIIKATVADHGTSSGWVDTLGDGQATFSSQMSFNTSYWLFDGVQGGGPDNWDGSTTPFGFKVTETDANTAVISLPNTTTNTTIRHVWVRGMAGSGTGGGGTGNDGVNFGVSGNNSPGAVTFSYLFVDNVGRCPFFLPNFGSGGVTIEYTLIGRFWAEDGNSVHGEIISTTDVAGPLVFRWNLVRDVKSTGGLMWDNHGDHNQPLYVYGNVFYQDPTFSTWGFNNGVLGGWTGASAEDCYNYHVWNNTFVNITAGEVFGINNMLRFGNNDAYNNLFYSVTSITYGNPFATHDHNHYIASGGTHSEANGTSSASGDPFVNYTTLNFRLTADTTAGNTAQVASQYRTDMYGRVGTTRGAIQYGS